MKNLLIVVVLLSMVGVVEGKPRYESEESARLRIASEVIQSQEDERQRSYDSPTSYIVDQRTPEDNAMALKNKTDNTLIVAGSVVLVGLFVSTALFLGLRPKKMTIARPIDRTP